MPTNSPSSPASNPEKHVARVELRHAIERALRAGFSWTEIIRLLAEVAPAEPVRRLQPSERRDPGATEPR